MCVLAGLLIVANTCETLAYRKLQKDIDLGVEVLNLQNPTEFDQYDESYAKYGWSFIVPWIGAGLAVLAVPIPIIVKLEHQHPGSKNRSKGSVDNV